MGERESGEEGAFGEQSGLWGDVGMEERETRRFSGAGRNSPNRWNIKQKNRSLPHL